MRGCSDQERRRSEDGCISLGMRVAEARGVSVCFSVRIHYTGQIQDPEQNGGCLDYVSSRESFSTTLFSRNYCIYCVPVVISLRLRDIGVCQRVAKHLTERCSPTRYMELGAE